MNLKRRSEKMWVSKQRVDWVEEGNQGAIERAVSSYLLPRIFSVFIFIFYMLFFKNKLKPSFFF